MPDAENTPMPVLATYAVTYFDAYGCIVREGYISARLGFQVACDLATARMLARQDGSVRFTLEAHA